MYPKIYISIKNGDFDDFYLTCFHKNCVQTSEINAKSIYKETSEKKSSLKKIECSFDPKSTKFCILVTKNVVFLMEGYISDLNTFKDKKSIFLRLTRAYLYLVKANNCLKRNIFNGKQNF